MATTNPPLAVAGDARRGMWPLPALLGWSLAWAVFALLRSAGAIDAFAFAGGSMVGVFMSATGSTRCRRLVIAGGFPLSLLASGTVAAMPAWAWLLPLALLALAYPAHAWRDAPIFPTPADALRGLQRSVAVAAGDRVLDAGCGLGHGLRALQSEYPSARIEGIERSWPLMLWCRLRCRWATVRQGDMWSADWSGYALVYLFQRPESMQRALAKARRELRPGNWLVSLEFPVAETPASAVIHCRDGRSLWLYRIGARS
jgi:hypothetical protein